MTVVYFRTFKAVLTLLAALCMPYYGLYAASPTPALGSSEELFTSRLRQMYGLPTTADVYTHALERVQKANEQLRIKPEDPFALRYLADAYHTLGHLEEFKENYSKAIEYHKSALENFSKTPLPSKDLRVDKIVHTVEHIFIDMYEMGYLAMMNQSVQQEGLFRRAIEFSREWKFSKSEILKSPAVHDRYFDLLRKAPGLMLPFTGDEIQLLYPGCDFLMSGGRNAFD